MIRQTFGATFSQRKSLMKGLAALAVALPLLAACSGDDEPAPYVEQPVEDLYNTAADTLAVGDDYELAAQQFEEVERQHPYSVWASKAQLMSAYSYYLANSYDDAIGALDRFVALHPGSPEVPYALYLKGLSYYEQISDVHRDQKMTQDALDALGEVVRRFPDSEYARDARLKIDLANDHLAGKEMTIGRYYLSKKNYLAALNRFQTVIRDFQTTTHVPEALHRLVEINLVLGLQGEAQATGAVLGYNFPGSDWYLDSYALLTGEDLRPEAQEGSWIGSVWNGIF
jgi:outer membrane protein assembly factor BamD